MTVPLSFFPVSATCRLAPDEKCGICLEKVADKFGLPIDVSLLMHSRHNVDSLFQWEITWLKSRIMPSLVCVFHEECLEPALAVISKCPLCRQLVEARKLHAQNIYNYSTSIQFMSGLVFAFNLILARNVLRETAACISDIVESGLVNFDGAEETVNFLQAFSQSRGAENTAFNVASFGLALIPSCLTVPLLVFKRIHNINAASPEVIHSIMGAALLVVLDGITNARLLKDEFEKEDSFPVYFFSTVLAVRVAGQILSKLLKK